MDSDDDDEKEEPQEKSKKMTKKEAKIKNEQLIAEQKKESKILEDEGWAVVKKGKLNSVGTDVKVQKKKKNY